MMTSLIANIVGMQLLYTYLNKEYKEDLSHPDLMRQILFTCNFTSNMTFNLAHWVFAFCYLALSYRMELSKKNMPEYSYNYRLNTINILGCLFNIIIPAFVWAFQIKAMSEAY